MKGGGRFVALRTSLPSGSPKVIGVRLRLRPFCAVNFTICSVMLTFLAF